MVNAYSPWFDYNHFPSLNPIISDIFSQFFLWKYLSVDIIKSGSLPLWNQYSFTGTPLLATYHSATLYPLNLLLFFLKPYSWGLFILSSSLLSSIFMYLFLSLYTKSSTSRIIGSLLFTFSSLMTTWLEFGTAVHSMAWLPLTLFLIYKFYHSEKLRFLILIPISISSMILAGNLQATTYVLLICELYSLLITKNLKKILLVNIFIFFAFFITALQILPSYDLLKNSIRTNDSYIQENNYGLLPLNKILEFFSADFYGHPSTRNYWGFLNYSESSNYLGIISLPLLIYSIFYLKNTGLKVFSIGFLLSSFILIFENPISLFIYETKIPLLTQSYASRVLFITLFFTSVLSALSLDEILTFKKYKIFSKTLLISTAIILAIILGTYLSRSIIAETFINSPDKFHSDYYQRETFYKVDNFNIAIKNTLIPFSILISLTIFLIIYLRFPTNKRLLLVLPLVLILATSLDLGRYFLKFNPYVPTNLVYPSTPTIEFLQQQPGFFRVGREHAEVLPPNTWMAYNLSSPEGYDALYLNDYGKFMHLINGGDFNTGSTGRYAEVTNYNSEHLNLTNTKYFIAILRDKNGQLPGDLINFQFNEAGFKPVFKDKSSVILENPDAMPRAYFKDGHGEIQITKYLSDHVSLRTNSNNSQVLVLADQYDLGWKAYVDGNPTQIIKTNYIFRGVEVPQGNHSIDFYYFPDSVNLGLKITAYSLLLLLLITILSIYKKRF